MHALEWLMLPHLDAADRLQLQVDRICVDAFLCHAKLPLQDKMWVNHAILCIRSHTVRGGLLRSEAACKTTPQ